MKDAAYYDKVYRGDYAVDEQRVQFVAELCRGRVLDIGSGDGALAVALGDGRQDFYVGLDFSREACLRAQKRAPGFPFDVRDFLGNRGLPTPDGPWDTIVLGELLEHLDDAAETKLLKKVKRALAPDGRLIVTTPNGDAVPDAAHVRTFHLNGMSEKLQPLGEVCGHAYSERYVIASAHPAGRPKLTVVLITKNEEELLGQCLESLQGVWDELVVVDTGSTDKTIEIAESFGAKIGRFPWIDDFAAARNYAESLCSGHYLYWQDADEILLEGKEAMRRIVEEGKEDGLSPKLIFKRDAAGNVETDFIRQELFHKHNGAWRWHGAAHNWLSGPIRTAAPQIVVEHLNRPSGDRPNHKDIFVALRSNLSKEAPDERNLFYLAREHHNKGHHHEAIGLIGLMLQTPISWPVQRARGCVIAGMCWQALGDPDAAAQAYLKAIEICPTVVEGFYYLGKLRYEQQRYAEGATWFKAATIPEPGGFFVDRDIYEWRRYDLLAVCLHKIGRSGEARLYGAKALSARPNDEQLKTNMAYYEGAA
jgi:SAM-dependent methyltransferase